MFDSTLWTRAKRTAEATTQLKVISQWSNHLSNQINSHDSKPEYPSDRYLFPCWHMELVNHRQREAKYDDVNNQTRPDLGIPDSCRVKSPLICPSLCCCQHKRPRIALKRYNLRRAVRLLGHQLGKFKKTHEDHADTPQGDEGHSNPCGKSKPSCEKDPLIEQEYGNFDPC